jgi:sugar phosphate isomerase/epimerase
MKMTRRAAIASAISASVLSAKTLKTFGAQLYSLRSIINDKPLEVLQGLESAGYTEAEVILGNIDKVWDSLKQTKLKPVSIHMDTALFFNNEAKLNAALDAAKAKGFAYVVCPYIAPKDRGGVDVIKKLADTLNLAGKRASAAGMQLCYHNHAFEFEPVAGGKGNLLDVLMENTDKKLVGLEFDIMWAQVGGVPPVEVFQKYGGRIPLVHLKNVAKGIGPQYNERVPKEAFQEVGSGVIDIPAVLRAAAKAGAKHYFVEQDQTPGDPLVSLRGSATYLKKTSF